MKLSRITRIRGHRVFHDFSWPSELHTFGQFNVIYGWNGCGKTTLASLLSLVEKRTALSEGELELEFDGKTKLTGRELAAKPVPQVRVFNRDFINATLQSAGGIAPIYFLGEESVEKQSQVDDLRKALASANTEFTTATSEKTSAESKLDEFCVSQARIIKGVLTTSNSAAYNNYDKRKFKQSVQGLTLQTAAMALITDEQKTTLRQQKDAQLKPSLKEVADPSVDLAALSKEVDELVGRSIVAQTLAELTSNANIASWVQQGLILHSGEHSSETCRFCYQPLKTSRRSALEAHFNDAFATFQRDLTALLSQLRAAKQCVGAMRVPEASRFYDHLAAEATSASGSMTAAVAAIETALDALIERVEAKRDIPFGSVSVAASRPLVRDSLTAAITALNVVIEKHNKTTGTFRTSVDDACKKLEGAYVAEAHAEYIRLAQAVSNADAALAKVQGKPSTIQGEINALEREIVEHQRPADELTTELREYLGRDELRFEVRGNGYALTRDGQPVSHLSEGERTAIAFLYFLKVLQDKSFDVAKGIVVIDDPVSSLDANALFSAFGFMKERTKQCGQLFIFTHSFPFFRLVKNWFHHLPRQGSPHVERRLGRFFLLRSRRHTDGSRTSELGPLDPLLQEHDSEYQYLFKHVYDAAKRNDVVKLEQHYGLPNVARRLVEAFLAFRYPDLSGELHQRFDRVNFDHAKKTRILRMLNTYSHASAIADPEHDLSLLAETQPVLIDMLEMMKAVDKEHYEGLEKLVATVATAVPAPP